MPDHAITPPEPTGPSLRSTNREDPVDTDGDGTSDRTRINNRDTDPVVVVERAEDSVALELPPAEGRTARTLVVGDLDADGHDELMVGVASDDPREVSRYFIVPGTTPAGTHAVDDVAVEVPPVYFLPAGDAVAGPGDDLVVNFSGGDRSPTHPGESRSEAYVGIVSGDALMSPGPGGTAHPQPHAGMRIDGELAGLFDLGDAHPAILTLTYPNRSGEGGGIIHLHRDGVTTRFAHGFVETRTLDIRPYGDRVLLSGGSSTRSGSTFKLWDIDEPCRPLPKASGASGAPPAGARPGASSYTG